MAILFPGDGANPDTTQLSQPTTPGIIIAANVRTIDPGTESYSLWATIGIGRVVTGELVRSKVQLTEGYVHRLKNISWTGFYLLQPDDHLYLTLEGDLTLRVEAQFRRLTPATAKLIQEVFFGTQPTT